MGAHGEVFLGAEQSQIFALLKGVSLEILQELLGHSASNLTSLFTFFKSVIDSNLQVASVDFVISASLTCLNSLGLDQHGLSSLFVFSVVEGQNCILVIFNHLHSGLLNRLANKDLKDRFNLHFIVK